MMTRTAKLFSVALTVIIAAFVLSTCNIFMDGEPFDEKARNVNGFKPVALVNPQVALRKALDENPGKDWALTLVNDAHPNPTQVADREWLFDNTELGNSLNRLAFGVSSRTIMLSELPVAVYRSDPTVKLKDGELPSIENKAIVIDRRFAPWGNILQDTDDIIDPVQADPNKGPTDRQIVLTAINQTNNAGKIAGSEDGITYYFKRVPRDINFRISADFYVDSFGFTGGRAELNGQEAFGFMARDWIPQHHNISGNWPGTQNPYIPSRPGFDGEEVSFNGVTTTNPSGIPKSGGAKFDLTEVGLKNVAWNGVYWNGEGTSLNDGVASSSNMIMVGGVKRGMRVYWRTGVRDPDGEKMPVYDFSSIANADFAKFDYKPRELSDYSTWGSGIEGTIKRPDFPTAGLKYKLTLERTNSGFIAIIEPPKGVGKGVTKTRTPSDGFILHYTDLELPYPDLLCGPTSVEREFYYIGLFAARDAKVTVTNLRYEESPASMCPTRIDPEPEVVAPTFNIQSPIATSSEDYTLYATSNVEGVLMVTFNGKPAMAFETNDKNWIVEPSNASARPFTLFTVSDIKLRPGDNIFDLVFYPDNKQLRSEFLAKKLDKDGNVINIPKNEVEYLLKDLRPITRSFMVNRRSLEGSDVFPLKDNDQDWLGAASAYGPRFKREVIWVAPNGKATGTGSFNNPLDLKTAITVSSVTNYGDAAIDSGKISSGQIIMLKDGVYTPMDPPAMIDGSLRIPIRLVVPRYNSGRANLTAHGTAAPQVRPSSDNGETRYPDPYADEYYRYFKVIKAQNRDKAIIDLRKDLRNSGYAPRNMEMNGDYWIIDGIHVRNAEDTYGGLRTHGSNNLFRWVKTYFNGDSGLWVSGYSTEPKSMWATNVRVEYCESFGNIDQARTNADGFAAKLTTWENIVFYRCISHHNTDDGWDLFAKKETGPIGAVRIEQSFAYSNGRYLNDEIGRNYSDSNFLAKANYSATVGGNGFKMGGEGIPIPHHVIHSLTWGNDGDGVTSNSDPAIVITHVSAFDNYNRVDTNPGSNFAVYSSSSPSYEGLDAVITQVLSWRSNPLGSRNDRLEPKAPSSGFVWRNYVTDHIHAIYDANNGKDSAVMVLFEGAHPDYPGGLKNRQLTGRSSSTLYISGKYNNQQSLTFGATFNAEPVLLNPETLELGSENFSAALINANNTGINQYFDTGRVITESDFITDPKTMFAYGLVNPTTLSYDTNPAYGYKRGIYNGGQGAAEWVSPFGVPGDMPYRRLDGTTAKVETRKVDGKNVQVGLANRADGKIHGDFLVVWDETSAGISQYFIGLPDIGDFMKVHNTGFAGGVVPGAHELWR